ncbi:MULTISPECIES: Na(+)/H(+) antiporter subunit C [Brevibacterium]|uniref:Na(+)/H(+) antiporter subunit C n=1 Tax=Brevibacterium TaxID=1696 RepID=UPI00227F88C9|nr:MULTISPECIES: Na(+)/H(+) antiporter subunit C [Brevibacterium]WAL39732.1 Na(+)/H(+) antiporter subunit C [Brevibacterium sp. BRM-1]
MTPPFVMLLTMGVLFACGAYLMLDRSLTRVLLGFLLFGNGANILIVLTGGRAGRPPITDGKDLSTDGMSDPLPHALVLTAIVITFAMTAFLLALIYRSWRLVRRENIDDDLEDIRVAVTKGRGSQEEAGTGVDQEDTEFGDEAENPVPGAPDVDRDGTPAERDSALDHEAALDDEAEPAHAAGGADGPAPEPGAAPEPGVGRDSDSASGSQERGESL